MRLYFNQITPNIISKGLVNNNVTIVPKIVKNELPDNSSNYIHWSQDCPIKKYKLNANPIRHYRKQYVNINSNMVSIHSLMYQWGNFYVFSFFAYDDYYLTL